MTMVKAKRSEGRGLFRSVSADGSHWLLSFLPNDGWMITRDGETVAAGKRDRASLEKGVQQFLLLTISGVGVDRLRRPAQRVAQSG